MWGATRRARPCYRPVVRGVVLGDTISIVAADHRAGEVHFCSDKSALNPPLAQCVRLQKRLRSRRSPSRRPTPLLRQRHPPSAGGAHVALFRYSCRKIRAPSPWGTPAAYYGALYRLDRTVYFVALCQEQATMWSVAVGIQQR